MEDWSKEFWEMFDTVTQEVEQFVNEVGELAEAIALEVQDVVETELDQWFESFVTPLLFPFDPPPDWEEFPNPELEMLFTEQVQPSLEAHPACIGCHHYHGQVYNGTLLVCAMHPYGSDSPTCPDWDGNPPQTPV
ncbi:hypothetical protein K4A83_18945 [Spirulina subsalsa FACHB-351]|uniref:Uncharacterized protein n=1 Tax=Spirulina subsalsa FACHB-351 TaxID=234711 RepID=A0ABT3LB69_9CYAN|nr:hypothetical protein [Spirulina subsalsa]MCW6038334.1 hypothetical protein [Spirulina subsalsa FACHB-351]